MTERHKGSSRIVIISMSVHRVWRGSIPLEYMEGGYEKEYSVYAFDNVDNPGLTQSHTGMYNR